MNNSIIDTILDENNCDNVILQDEDGKTTEFEQLAIIPIDDKMYVLLHPVVAPEGSDGEEAFVFYVDEDNDCLTLETNDDIIDEVFEEFNDLLKEENE